MQVWLYSNKTDDEELSMCMLNICTQVDPLVSLMKVEKVPDSTYDMIGGLDQQIKEIKEVNGYPVLSHWPLNQPDEHILVEHRALMSSRVLLV